MYMLHMILWVSKVVVRNSDKIFGRDKQQPNYFSERVVRPILSHVVIIRAGKFPYYAKLIDMPRHIARIMIFCSVLQ